MRPRNRDHESAPRAGESLFGQVLAAITADELSLERAVDTLLDALTDTEMLGLLDGDKTLAATVMGLRSTTSIPAIEAGRVDRLGIPGLRFTDGPRGVSIAPATSFPVAIARAATWDVDIERRVGAAIGIEARAVGANLWGGLCINVAPAPGWGRAQESYGEDPLLIGEMGAAAVEGSKPWVITSVKHYALNSMEQARFQVDVRVAEDVLHERYLPHFRRAVEAGVDSVMSAYNSVNGQWAGQNHHLLTDVLRVMWQFTGFVHTDWVWGLRDPVRSVAAGQDVEMPFRQQRARALPKALRTGALARSDVRLAASRILGVQLRYALRANPEPDRRIVANDEHRRLAREVAQRATVLLRNQTRSGDAALPLNVEQLSRVAVVGRLADCANLGDSGSSRVFPPSTVSVLQGLTERLGDRVVTCACDSSPSDVAQTARGADAAVVVVGFTPEDEGESLLPSDTESLKLFGGFARWPLVAPLLLRLAAFARRLTPLGGDRPTLRLHDADIAVIRAVAEVNQRTVVVVIGGGTPVIHPWDTEVAAVLLAWYPGMEGGRALADIVLGDAEPAGRLPVAIPEHQWQLPEVDWLSTSVTYGRWWGQRKLDHDGVPAAYPLGFGRGYSTFVMSDADVRSVDDETFEVTVAVTNTGDRPGRHIVQVYACLPIDARPVRHLVGFAPATLAPHTSTNVVVTCSTRPVQRWTPESWVLPEGDLSIEVASHAGDPEALRCVLVR